MALVKSNPGANEADSGFGLKAVIRRLRNRAEAKRARALSQVKFRLSREGIHFVLILLFILIGAVLRDIALLIVLAGVMLALLLIQWRLGRLNVSGLKFKRMVPTSTVCGSPVDVTVTVGNSRRWTSAWLLSVEESITQLAPHLDTSPEKGLAVVDDVAPRTSRNSTYQVQFRRRGVFEFGSTVISTRYPLNLGYAHRSFLEKSEITVHPRLGELSNRCQELLRVQQQGLSKAIARAGVHEGEFYGLRQWHNGDSQRWIHWRTTARLGELCVRQFEQQQRMQVTVVLDLHQSESWAVDPTQSDETVESAISFVATLAAHLVGRSRHKMSVAIAGRELHTAEKVQSRVLVNDMLDALARATSAADNSLAAAIESLQSVLSSTPQLIVVSTRENCMESVQNRMSDSYTKRMLNRLNVRWLNVTAGDLEPYFQWSENK